MDICLNISTTPVTQKQKKARRQSAKPTHTWKPKVKQDLLERLNYPWKNKTSHNDETISSVKPSLTSFVRKKFGNDPKASIFIPNKKDLDIYVKKTAAGIKPKTFKDVRKKGTSTIADAQSGENPHIPAKDTTVIDVRDSTVFPTKSSKPNRKPQNDNPKTGKISSLFGNNPFVPTIGQRLVVPITETVFSGSKFSELAIHDYAVKNLSDNLQIEELTSVQKKAIPILCTGSDALIRSQTGSGKTLAYALPIIENLHAIRPKLNRSDGVRALIIVPTRELALQTYELLVKLVKPFTWIVPGYLVGGEKRKAEKARLRKGITILVGTPGRLLDHVQHTDSLKLDKIEFLVLDEADRMLEMGYELDIKNIIEALSAHKKASTYDPLALLKSSVNTRVVEDDDDPESSNAENAISSEQESSSKEDAKKVQTILLSATLSKGVQQLAGLTLKNPQVIETSSDTQNVPAKIPINQKDITENTEQLIIPQSVIQKYVVIPPKLRLVTLSSYIIGKANSNSKLLIFMATQDMIDFHAEMFSAVLVRGENDVDISDEVGESDNEVDNSEGASDKESIDGNAGCLSNVQFFKLHGSMSQKERTDVFTTFRAAKTGVLLCTDVAARGLDLPKVDCVVQYTGPISSSDYVHRVGRTARAGAKGEAVLFLTPPELEFVRQLESKRIRLKQENMDLSNLSLALDETNSSEAAATELQQRYENAVLSDKRLKDLACKAFSSWVRFYACYPRDMRASFNMKEVHLGHYAKSFALRDPPSTIGGFGQRFAQKSKSSGSRFSRGGNFKAGQKRPFPQRNDGNKMGRTKRLIVSEFDSGLPQKKRKKNQ